MEISKSIEIEGLRTTAQQFRTIHLCRFRDYIRAYEVSAFRMVSFVREMKAVKHTDAHSADGFVVYVGFPDHVNSWDNHTPEGSAYAQLAEDHWALELPADALPTDADVAQFAERFKAWKESLPVSPEKKKKDKAEAPALPAAPAVAQLPESVLVPPPVSTPSVAPSAPATLFGIASQIMAFDVAAHSAYDCQHFVLRLQQRVRSLIC